jgi:hypothetical protein
VNFVPFCGYFFATIEAMSFSEDGNWFGALKVMGAELRLVLHLTRMGEGFTGTLDSIDQEAFGLELSAIRFSAATLRFEFPAGDGRFEGTRASDGASIEGSWTQGGFTTPLVLTRTPHAPRLRPQMPEKPYPYDEEEVAYDNPGAPGLTLAGTLTLPRSAGPHPAVVLITGSAQHDRDEKDLQVPFRENLDVIKTALAAAGNTSHTCVAFPDLNHLFQHCVTGLPIEYGQIEETFAPVALETISSWILRTCERPPAAFGGSPPL